MSFRLPPEAWEQLQTFLALHPTCEVTFLYHQGVIRKVVLQQTVTVRDSQDGEVPVPVPVSARRNGHLRAT